MPKLNLTHNATVNLTYQEKRLLLGMARNEGLTVSALIRKLLIAAVSGQGAVKPG